MSQMRCMFRAAVLLLMVGAGFPARSAAPTQTQWKLANFTWVQRVAAEAGAPANAHPAALTDEALAASLGPVQVMVEGKMMPLFAPDELKGLLKALREALSVAQPGEDLILLSTSRRGGRFMEMPEGLTARLFVREGALNLIVHDARLTFMDRYSADRTLPTFAYGSRMTASAESLLATGVTTLRKDWLALPLAAVGLAAAKPTLAPAPVAVPVAAKPTPPESTGARDAAFFEAQTQRLKALKKLRDENLLSEAEYQEKREAILKTL